MTDLDRKLQEIAQKDWQRFVEMVGEENIIAAKACLLRQAGSSYGEICIKLNITSGQVRYACTKCPGE